jgi:5-methylcytosine-specific restriction endonuclease McrA
VKGHLGQVHRALRVQVLAEEERCRNPYCRAPYDNPTLDYVQPLSKGGQQVRENAQRLCLHCNSSRHDTPWSEFLAREAELARLRGGSGGYAR